MKVDGKVVVVTGGASGIGAALVRRFVREGARAVVVADKDGDGARAVADEMSGRSGEPSENGVAYAVEVDVAREEDVTALIDETEARQGPVDLFCSNAGVFRRGGLETSTAEWERMLEVNLVAHIHAARVLVPRMIERGGGYLLHTASAAGLLAQIGSVTYSVTKHAAVAFAEWISITHGDDGIGVSVLCPQAVRTPMLTSEEGSVASVDGVIEPEAVADAVVEGLEEERFLILPHPEVSKYVRRRADDRERWLAGMRRLHAHFEGAGSE